MSLTTTMLGRGAGDRDYEAFVKAASDVGAEVWGEADTAQSAIVMSVPPEALGTGVALMADALLKPRLDEREWTVLQAQTHQGLMSRRMKGASLGYSVMEDLLYPARPGRAAVNATPASVAGLGIVDVRAMYRRLFTPRTMTIYSVGPLSVGEVGGVLEPALGGWTTDSQGVAPLQHLPTAFGEGLQVKVVPTLGQETQANIFLARPAPGFKEPGFISALAVARLLGGDFTSRLNQVLREEKGYSYGVSAYVNPEAATDGVMVVSTAVELDKVGDSLKEILAGFAGLASQPVTAEELNRTTMATATSTAGSVETSGSLATLVLQATGLDMTAEGMTALLDEVIALELPTVQAEATALSSLDRALVVIAGDPAVIVPQLEAIGIADVEVLEGD